jgi:hypothetical protein
MTIRWITSHSFREPVHLALVRFAVLADCRGI